MPEELERLDDAIGPDRRTFVKRLVVGTAFAAPIVSSFTMSGIEAVFGTKVGATTLMGNSNTVLYPTLVKCGNVTPTGLAITGSGGGGTQATVGVPTGALANNTMVCVRRGNPSSFAALLPAGYTPESAFAVTWGNTNATLPIMLTVNDPAVDVGDQIFVIMGSNAQSYPGAVGTDLWAALFTKDPDFVVARPPAAPVTPPAGGGTAAGPVEVTPKFTG